VRAEVSVARWGEVIRSLLPGRPRPRCHLSWPDGTSDAREFLAKAAAVSGVDLVLPRDATTPPDAILDWTGLAPRPPLDALVERARSLRAPLLSDDRGRFGKGAAVVVVPDGALLGRVAADAARRLRAGEGAVEALRLTVRRTEVWVDLEAADAEGLKPPLPFLATADRLRRGLAPAGGGSGGPPGPPR
jgi:hypothetical protein